MDFAAALDPVRRTDLSALAKGYYGASIMPVEILKEMQRRLPQVRLWNLYARPRSRRWPRSSSRRPAAQGRFAGGRR